MLRWRSTRAWVVAAARGYATAVVASTAAREDLTRTFTKVKDEAKGQTLDLNEMADAARNSLKSIQDIGKKHNVEDAAFRAKMGTLNASLKAYTSRLSNLQNEARGIQNDVDALLKLVWGSSHGATAAPTPQETVSKSQDTKAPEAKKDEDISFEAPPMAQRLEEINAHAPKDATSAPIVETVEGEVVRDTPSTPKAEKGETEIEVEAVEIEPSIDDMSVTEITKELHEQNIDFSDCLDAKSLRKRYQDVRDGKLKPPEPVKKAIPQQQQATPKRVESVTPPSNQSYSQDQNYEKYRQQQPPPNTTERGLTPDPHPGANRKMVDPMKFIWEVKVDLAKENNVKPEQIDLWCQKIRLDDSKRLYEYPQVQGNAIEIRQKGDMPK